jgi:hypothetical protein
VRFYVRDRRAIESTLGEGDDGDFIKARQNVMMPDASDLC